MKKFALAALALVMALGLCACRRGNNVTTAPTTTQATVPTTTAATLPTVETNIPDPSINTSMPTVTLEPTFDTTENTYDTTGTETTGSESARSRRGK